MDLLRKNYTGKLLRCKTKYSNAFRPEFKWKFHFFYWGERKLSIYSSAEIPQNQFHIYIYTFFLPNSGDNLQTNF